MRTVVSFAWSFLEQVAAKAVTMVVQIILARILLPEEFGVMAILLVAINVADAIAQSGFGLALIQDTEATDSSWATAFWFSILISLVMYGALFLIAPLLALFYSMDSLTMYLRVLGAVVLLNAVYSILRARLQKRMDFRHLFIVSTAASLGSGVIGIGFAINGLGIWSLIFQVLAQSFLSIFISLFFVKWRPCLVFDIQSGRRLFRYGWKICMTGILNVIYSGVSELIIGRSCSPAALGYYTQGRKYPYAAITIISNALQNVMFPAFSSIQEDRPKLRQALKRMLQIGTFVIAPLSMMLTVAADPIVLLLLTEKWLPCVPIFQFVCISNCVIMLQLVNLRAYMAIGDSGLYLKLQIIKVTVGFVLIASAAILTNSIYWVAFITCVFGFIAVIGIDMQPSRRVLGYGRSQQLKDVSMVYGIAFISAVPSALLSALDLPAVGLLLLQLIAYVSVYLGLARLLRMDALQETVEAAKGLFRR